MSAIRRRRGLRSAPRQPKNWVPVPLDVINLSLTTPLQSAQTRWHRKSSRQSQEKADGVAPVGFFSGYSRYDESNPANRGGLRSAKQPPRAGRPDDAPAVAGDRARRLLDTASNA